MSTIIPTLTTFPLVADEFHAAYKPGDGVCVFFFDSRNEFYPGGPGSALGYAPYVGDMTFNASTSAEVNPIAGAYLGIGFDVKGEFGTTVDSKTGYRILGTENSALTSCAYNTLAPNTITTRSGELSSYRIISTTPNLDTYPLSGAPDEGYSYGNTVTPYTESPPITLHQSVTSKDDVKFTSVRVTLQNACQRVLIEMKGPDSDRFYPYQLLDLESGVGPRQLPGEGITELRTGISFSTSDSVMNCDIKNISVMGAYSPIEKKVVGLQPPSTAKYRMVVSGAGGCL